MLSRQIEHDLKHICIEFPIIAILGPRQSGKTTIAQKVFSQYEYVSLEDRDNREFAEHDPRGFLERYKENIIFDEIQQVPSLMSYLQTHVDKQGQKGKIVITGSHNFLLMEKISQSLAGRVGITTLLPFSYYEISGIEKKLDTILFKGFYPRIYDQNIRPEVFYKNYISTYIEKDIRQIKQITQLGNFSSFIKILAGRSGQELNTNALSAEIGVSHNTIKDWISVLEASYIVYRLQPYHKNYNKRIVKNPKIYFTDTGLVCNLLGIRKKEEVEYHFLRGNLFETFIVNEFMKYNYNFGEKFDLYFWRDNHKKEIDIILESGLKKRAFEIKSGKTIHEKFFDTLKFWNSLTEMVWENMYLVYGGDENYRRNGMNVISWNNVFKGAVADTI